MFHASLRHRDRFSRRHLMRWTTTSLLSLTGLMAALTGIFLLFVPSGGFQGGRNPSYGATLLFTRGTWVDIHVWSGVAMLILAVIHLALHHKWLGEMMRRSKAVLLGRRRLRQTRVWTRDLAVWAVVVTFLVVITSSVYFLFSPGHAHAGGGSGSTSFLFSRSTWDLLHTWGAIGFIAAAAVHLAMSWKRLARLAPAVLRPVVAQAD
jgi:hypothetical protein